MCGTGPKVPGVDPVTVGALAESGTTRGCNPPVNDRLCPDDSVSREQVAAFLVRAGLAN